MTIPFPPPAQPGYQPSYQPSYVGYGVPGYAPAPPVPQIAYSRWSRRAAAFVIDFAPAIVAWLGFLAVYVLGLRAALAGATRVPTGVLIAGIAVVALGLLALGWVVYNRWIVAGRAGRSLGKRRLGLVLVSESSGRPIGAGNAFLRDVVHLLDAFTLVGFLWPMWDEKRQTFADMLVRTAVVDARAVV